MRYHIDNIPFDSGKYSSSTAYQIANIDPKYIIDNGPYHYTYLLISTILFLLLLTAITVIRALESRNEWRDMIKEGDVEAMEGLSYRKRVEKEMDEDGIK